jgi:hypothetical protein
MAHAYECRRFLSFPREALPLFDACALGDEQLADVGAQPPRARGELPQNVQRGFVQIDRDDMTGRLSHSDILSPVGKKKGVLWRKDTARGTPGLLQDGLSW